MSATITNIFTGQRRTLNTGSDLVAPWCLDLCRKEFVELKIFSLMQRIFTDCYRFSTKMKNKDKERALFDSIVYKDAQFGLISTLAYLIANKAKRYLVYDHGVIREASPEEKEQIDKDYKNGMTYKYGIIVDFEKYSIARLLCHYFHQIYTIEQANNNSISLGGSVQYKVKDYRAKIGYQESQSDDIKAQASEVIKYAKDGKPIVIDREDSLEQTEAEKNVQVAESSREKTYRELAAALGGTVAYLTGQDEVTTGSGASYERLDARNEDMIKNFWMTVFQPVVDSLLNEKINFVSQKWMTIKENLGSISLIESIDCIPDTIKASVIKKLIGDNTPDPKDELEKEIIGLLEKGREASNAFPEDNEDDEITE